MLDETDIQKLLRLKRHEQPPAGYHEKFLQDFHRRQRSEMLRQPVWKIALERMETFFDYSMGRASYAAATAAVLLFAGVASFNMLSGGGSSTGGIAVNAPTSTSSSVPVAFNTPTPGSIGLNGQYAHQNTPLPQPTNAGISDPHYVIDSRPVSYERPFSF